VQKNIKFVTVQQAKQIHQYGNIKEKLCKAKAARWYNKTSSRLSADEPSSLKHGEDIKKIKILKIRIQEM
jgi:hypothetical protein